MPFYKNMYRRENKITFTHDNLLTNVHLLASCLLFGSYALLLYDDDCYLIGLDHGWQASKDSL
jgi:hypothetical protein